MLLNLTEHQGSDVDKIYLNIKDPFESTYQLLINEREKVGIKQTKYAKSLIDFSQLSDNVYGNLEDYKLTKKRKV